MNPSLNELQSYPFEKLRLLLSSTQAPRSFPPINLSIGEPKHPTPEFIKEALIKNSDGLAKYPSTLGSQALRDTIASWLQQRYQIPLPCSQTQILPVAGSREALFSFAQVVLNSKTAGVVLSPNPFYQIYEGAAILGGAKTAFYHSDADNHWQVDWQSIPTDTLKKTQLIYVCSPNNPTGRVMSLSEWQQLFNLADQYHFVIAADECYSEIYFDEKNPPLGALQAAHQLGRDDFKQLVVFSSLSKRSNVPGLRSGFVAGDAKLLNAFLQYRTYHGTALSETVASASIAAWSDEEHVKTNRRLYKEKFATCYPLLRQVLDVQMPEASFYFWLKVPGNDALFCQQLFAAKGVTLLPGSFLGRVDQGINPAEGYVRVALVDQPELCIEATQRIVDFIKTYA